MTAARDLTKSQLFLDDEWIADATLVSRQWHQPMKFPEPVLKAEHPWEQCCPVMFGTVLYQAGRFRMWYCAWTREVKPRVCYAESTDGVQWQKPPLGLCDFQGSKDNNIVLQSRVPDGLIDDVTVIHDPEDADWPMKALYWDSARDAADAEVGIYAARSKDGIHWDRSPGLVLPSWGDRFNGVSQRVGGKYVVLGRAPGAAPNQAAKGRTVWRTESQDFRHWSKPVLVLASDVEDPPLMQYYSATMFPYSDMVLGTIERMYMSPDRLDCELIFSRDDGRSWRHARERPAFLPLGAPRSWDDTWICLPTNGPITYRNRLFFYYSGRSGAHQAPHPLNHGAIGLALLRIDGFASIHASEVEGCVTTPPVRWPQNSELSVNCDPRRDLSAHPGFAHGRVTVEVLDKAMEPIEGYAREDCEAITRNTLHADGSHEIVSWANGRSLAALAGREVQLKFVLSDAHLYSFRATDFREA